MKEHDVNEIIGTGTDEVRFRTSQKIKGYLEWFAYGIVWGLGAFTAIWFVLSIFSSGGIILPAKVIFAKFATAFGNGHLTMDYIISGKSQTMTLSKIAVDSENYLPWALFRAVLAAIPAFLVFVICFLRRMKDSITRGITRLDDEHISGRQFVDPDDYQMQLDVIEHYKRQDKYFQEPRMLVSINTLVSEVVKPEPTGLFVKFFKRLYEAA